MLCKTKNPAAAGFFVLLAGRTGVEPATFGSTVRRSNQLSYRPKKLIVYITELFSRQAPSHKEDRPKAQILIQRPLIANSPTSYKGGGILRGKHWFPLKKIWLRFPAARRGRRCPLTTRGRPKAQILKVVGATGVEPVTSTL